jgi:Domain of unknown function (DUF5122) beta-propeller
MPLTCALPLLQQPGPFWFSSPALVSPLAPQLLLPTLAFARQPDGVLILAGAFDSVNGEPRRRLDRVNPDGSLRGRLLPQLKAGAPLQLLLPAEVEFPYVLETSLDLSQLDLASGAPSHFFRARPAP